MKFWSRGEVAFLAALAIAGAVDGLFLWRSLGSPRAEGDGRAIGRIYFRQNRAERRESGQVLWDGLVQGAPIYDQDTIRTSKDSLATIVLDGEATRIEMSEETLIFIDLAGRSAGQAAPGTIEIQGGAYVVKAPGSPALRLSSAGGTVAVESGRLSVTATAEQMAVIVGEGRATLGSAAGKIALDASNPAAVARAGSVPAAARAIEVLAPRKGLALVAFGAATPVDFAWKLPPGVAAVRLVAARDASLADPAVDESVEGETYRSALGAGTWYWRLSAGGIESPVQRFTVARDSAPDPLKPADAAKVAGGGALVDYSWKPSAYATGYRLEIARDPAFSAPALVSATTFAARISLPAPPEGGYYWRAVALYSAPGSSASVAEFPGRAAFFEVTAPKLAPPALPATPILASEAAADAGAITASWDPVPGAGAYEVTLSRDEAGADVVLRERTESSYLKVDKGLEKGDYYITVRSEAEGRLSAASAPRLLSVLAPEPLVALSPKADAVLPPSPPSLAFSWRDPNRGARYRLEVAEDPAFERVVASTESASAAASVGVTEALRGRRYWRAVLLGDDGAALAMSAPARFTFPRALPAPANARPGDGEKIDLVRVSKIAFDWSPVEGATEYRIDLYRVGAGDGVKVREWSTKTPGFVLDGSASAADDYAWDIVALRKDGDAVVASSPPLTRYFSLIQSKPLGSPVLGPRIEVFVE